MFTELCFTSTFVFVLLCYEEFVVCLDLLFFSIHLNSVLGPQPVMLRDYSWFHAKVMLSFMVILGQDHSVPG